jgi:hypothetical protein
LAPAFRAHYSAAGKEPQALLYGYHARHLDMDVIIDYGDAVTDDLPPRVYAFWNLFVLTGSRCFGLADAVLQQPRLYLNTCL